MLYISRTIHHMIAILVHMCKMMISRIVFFIFQDFYFLGCWREMGRGGRMGGVNNGSK